MDLLLLHLVLLVWLSVGTAARWTDHPADRFIAAGAIGWANVLATCLLLSVGRMLGEARIFFFTSVGVSVLVWVIAWLRPARPGASGTGETAHPGLRGFAACTLFSLALASAVAAANYLPSSPAALAHELPRALLQVGEGSIFPLQTVDARQILLPFNHGLLHTWALVYQPPLPVLNFFNLAGWCFAGLSVHRLCRVAGAGPNSSLAAAWCALLTTPLLAHAASADNGLPAAAALVAGAAFLLDGAQRRRTAPSALGGLLLGLAAGSNVGALLTVILAAVIVIVTGVWRRNRRTALAVLPGLAFGSLPFMLNPALVAHLDWSDLIASLQRAARGAAGFNPEVLLPLWAPPGLFQTPTEDTVGLGLPGLACLVAAVLALLRPGTWRRPTTWIAGLGLLWLLVLVVAGRWLPTGSSELMLVVLLTAPALAAWLDFPRHGRSLLFLGAGLVAAGGLWSASLYVWNNARRPLAPLVDPSLASIKTSQLPPLLEHRLASESRINISSDGEDALLLALMEWQQQQRYGARDQVDADAYNVISRSSRSRNRTLGELPEGPLYLLVAFPAKPTAGVETLGSIGLGDLTRDYFGLSGDADNQVSLPTNRALLLTLAQSRTETDTLELRCDLKGLNPRDRSRVEFWAEHGDGRRTLLHAWLQQGRVTLARPADLKRLHLRITSLNDGRELGAAQVQDAPPWAIVTDLPPDGRRLYGVQLVQEAADPRVLAPAALTGVEGPFPQWNLPRLRWARAETVRLQLPPMPEVRRIRVQLSARLYLRPRAVLEIVGNGELLQRIEFPDPVAWHEAEVEFAARDGENVIELRDGTLPPEPDWEGYLRRYQDVKRHVEMTRQPPKTGALEHYKHAGRPEGRIMDFRPVPRPAPDAYYFMFRNLRVEGWRE